MDAQIKKGILELCILHYIEQESLYGYDIIQTMHGFFPEVTESTFYAILRRLHKEGAATVEEGQRKLERMKEEWRYLRNIMDEMGIS